MKPANPRILTINGGSSSIKFALFEAGGSLRRILAGGIERIGLPEAVLRVRGLDQADDLSRLVTAPDHMAAVDILIDWLFTTGEALRGDSWFPKTETAGPVLARGVPDGPDENFEKLLWTLLGALSIARHSVRILTPYFLPDPVVVSALNLASMRGVQVDIILPARSNLPFISRASRAMWSHVLQHGCRIWLTPPPFDHSKLMLVDGCWVLLGSANWDPRSLRLNFEFNVECYDVELARRLDRLFEAKRKTAHPVTMEEVDGRSLPARLCDGAARLLTPYLQSRIRM